MWDPPLHSFVNHMMFWWRVLLVNEIPKRLDEIHIEWNSFCLHAEQGGFHTLSV